GRGGSGSLRRSNVSSPDVLVVSSLAKGFGVPVAVLAGSEAMVRRFEASSETRVHCSPPSTSVIHAAEHALAVNESFGDRLRLRLAQLVLYFRNKLKGICLSVTGGLFPVQTLRPVPELNAATLHDRLLQCGIRTALHRGPRISFLITARHKPSDIDGAADALGRIARIWSAKAKILEASHEVRTQYRV
ncbi:MAG: aminotransferase class I/II-fold pyridoxal phosphate-dependent enzyme, partial [Lysobacterales bacterium]